MSTESELRDWRDGQTNAERLCTGILGIVLALLGRRQDAGQIVFDLDAVLVGDHGNVEADQNLQLAKCQAKAIRLRRVVEPKRTRIRAGRVGKGSEGGAHRSQTIGKRVTRPGVGQLSRQEEAYLVGRLHAVQLVAAVADAEEQPMVVKIGNDTLSDLLVAGHLLPVKAEAERRRSNSQDLWIKIF
jgi:hypothetical protein